MLKVTHHVSAQLKGSSKRGLSGPIAHKVAVTVTGKRDLLRFSDVVEKVAAEEVREDLFDLASNLRKATRFSITMPADAWQSIERQLVGARK